jgi:prepilin-type N-terminal cleavage/methylation domain-containing protein
MIEGAGTTKAFTLVEMIIVVMIVGILATIALPLFEKTRERTYDKEALVNLKLIQAAERIYAIEYTSYYNSLVADELNDNLKLTLPAGNRRLWDYEIQTAGGGNDFAARAVRRNAPLPYQRTWLIDATLEDATCESGPCNY